MAEFDMSSLKPNSNKYKAGQQSSEKEKMAPIKMKGSVSSSKKSLFRKIRDSFLPEDVGDVKSYIIFEKIIPGIQDLILESLEMRFRGEVTRRDRYYDDRRGRSRYDYNARYRSSSNSSNSGRRNRDSRDNYEDDKIDYRRIILDHREDAEEVVKEMRERIIKTGSASIADLLNLLDIASDYTDNDWGWINERDINWRRISSGFLIDVPTARYLDD